MEEQTHISKRESPMAASVNAMKEKCHLPYLYSHLGSIYLECFHLKINSWPKQTKCKYRCKLGCHLQKYNHKLATNVTEVHWGLLGDTIISTGVNGTARRQNKGLQHVTLLVSIQAVLLIYFLFSFHHANRVKIHSKIRHEFLILHYIQSC